MGEADPLAALVEEVASEVDVVMARPEKVRSDCARLRERLGRPPAPGDDEALGRLAPLLRKRAGEVVTPLFELLEEQAATSVDPWPLLEGLLLSRDETLARRALGTLVRLADGGSLSVDRRVLRFLAEQVEVPGSVLGEPEALATIARLVRGRGAGAGDPILSLYREPSDFPLRRLAARLLDLDGQPAPLDLALSLLGSEAHAFLARYLRFTRATHGDLLHLLPDPGRPPPALPSLRGDRAHRPGP